MIGVFDSGVGGLTVVRAIMNLLPGYDIVYFGDTARTPYGGKSAETIVDYAIQDANILLERGAKLIVVGCNSASSVATGILRERLNVPLFEVISPAVREAVSNSNARRVGIIGTRATVNSGAYQNQIKAIHPEIEVLSASCPLLVPLVEEGWLKRSETKQIVKRYLYPLKIQQVDTLILGCTHYPLLKDIIQIKIGRRVRVIDSSEALSRSVKSYLDEHPQIASALTREGNTHIYVSDVTEHFQRLANSILKTNNSLSHVKL